MKVIIPVAGAGTKLRPHTYTQPKALIPMAGKTILSVIIDDLLKHKIDEFIFVIGYLGDKIQDYVEQRYPNIQSTFVTQIDRRGTGHAILLTKEFVGDDEILIVFGDTICDFDIEDFLHKKASQIGIRRVENPGVFGVAELGKDNEVMRVVEKPKIPKSNMAMVGVYKIVETAALFDSLETYLNLSADADGEYHLTHSIQTMIEKGIRFEGFKVNSWFDCGKKETLLETNATLLHAMEGRQENKYGHYENTVIIPPVNIGEGCEIQNSIIGPSVSIGENTKIKSSIIQNSIIGSYAELDDVVLKLSIIGSDAYVRGFSQNLNIGDNTDIDLG